MRTVETLAELLEILKNYLSSEKISRVRRAYFFSEQAHEGQFRKSGEPYVIHPLAVAGYMAQMHMDHQSIIAALLHDVLEDTPVSKKAMVEQFGEGVADIVDGVSKLTHLVFDSKEEELAENFQKMVLAMARDIRVILVKLADRLHNMRTLGAMPPAKRRQKARETYDIYAPIAHRLGIGSIYRELEDHCFKAMHPWRYEVLSHQIKKFTGNRKAFVDQVIEGLGTHFKEEGIECQIIGRQKHLYSIYRKMKRNLGTEGGSFEDVMDVYGFRVITEDNIDSCYRILGKVHNFYKPQPNGFKDYIAMPKINGYQSLHTLVRAMHGTVAEIQIRTQGMEAMANNGVSGHWLYKTGDSNDANPAQARAIRWVKSLLDIHHSTGSSLEFIENVKVDLFPDEIYVFTPKGKIMELPKGATPVDFAYAVHTDIGNRCHGAKVNKKVASLSKELQSGDTVDVILRKDPRPNPGWLNFVSTGKARTNIRNFLKSQQAHESEHLGRRLLKRALSQSDMVLEAFDDSILASTAQENDLQTWNELLKHIGLGNITPWQVANRLLNAKDISNQDMSDTSQLAMVSLKAEENMVLKYAKCCTPILGDEIVGIISKGQGIQVHQSDCRNVLDKRVTADRLVEVSWEGSLPQDFVTDILLEMQNRRGVLASVTAAVSAADANIEGLNMTERDATWGKMRISVAVKDRVHLAQVIRKLRAIKAAAKITRIRN